MLFLSHSSKEAKEIQTYDASSSDLTDDSFNLDDISDDLAPAYSSVVSCES